MIFRHEESIFWPRRLVLGFEVSKDAGYGKILSLVVMLQLNLTRYMKKLEIIVIF